MKKVGIFLLVPLMLFCFGVIVVTSPDIHAKTEKAEGKYHCPMHPQVTSDKPGDCPICGMRLVPTSEPAAISKDPNSVCLMHNCPMMKNGQKCPMIVLAEKGEKLSCPVCGEAIATETQVKAGPRKIIFYRHPMRPEVTSPVPSKDEMGMEYIPVYNDEVGTATQTGAASPLGYASVMISPERQQLIGIKTSVVEKKDANKVIRAAGRIAYDPELYQAEAEFIQSYRSLNNAKTGSDAGSGGEWAAKLLESSKTKLARMGLNSQMIESLQSREAPDKSLLYAVPEGDTWVYANIYEYEVSSVKVGDTLNMEVSSVPGKKLQGTIRAIDTVVDPVTRTVRVRAQVKNEGGLLKPDMYVNVSLEIALGQAILVPEEAVFFTGKTNIVFVDKGNGLFEPRLVTLGQKAGNAYAVAEGLSEGERVVTNGNFLVDSESKLKAALSGMGSHS